MIRAAARITNTKEFAMSTRSLARVAAAAPVALSWTALMTRLSVMRATRRQRRALARLDVAALADIGLTPEAAAAEARRPVWDVTPSWRS
jgi:uncharacterized protein YjiS (DUF1127 family)